MFEDLDAFVPNLDRKFVQDRKITKKSGRMYILPAKGEIDTQRKRMELEFNKIKKRMIDNNWDVSVADEAWQCVECAFTMISFYCTLENIKTYWENRPAGLPLTKDEFLSDAGNPDFESFNAIYYSKYRRICGTTVTHELENIGVEDLEVGNVLKTFNSEKEEVARIEFINSLATLRELHFQSRGFNTGFEFIECIDGEDNPDNLIKIKPLTDKNAKSLVLDSFKTILDYLNKNLNTKNDLQRIKDYLPKYPSDQEIQAAKQKDLERRMAAIEEIFAQKMRDTPEPERSQEAIKHFKYLSVDETLDTLDTMGILAIETEEDSEVEY